VGSPNEKEEPSVTQVQIPVESIGRVDLLLGQATALTAVWFDELAARIQEAMGLALYLAAAHPCQGPVEVPGLDGFGVLACVEAALREVQSWDLLLAADLPGVGRLEVVLSDVRQALAAAEGRG
jgi:hypothetical protein